MGRKKKRRAAKPAPSTQVTFRLKRVLDEHHARGHGTIAKLVEATGLERHLVSKLVQGRVRSISWDTLARICKYLHKEYGVPASDLPGLLFGFEATDFWSMLAQNKVAICLGVRRIDRVEPRWVNAYDAYLLGGLMRQLFGLGHEQLSDLEQNLMPSVPSDTSGERFQRSLDEAQKVYQRFSAMTGDRSLICLGSVKSNPLSESIIASVFKTRPFVSQDGVRSAKRRSCPFFLHFRRRDPTPPSCHGGETLTRTGNEYLPGIHFETKAGRWEYCPTNDEEDAAFVVYSYRPHEGAMELVLGGFSGRATGAVALELGDLEGEIWPPNYERDDLRVGMFVIRFRFDKPGKSRHGVRPILIKPTETEVIRLAPEVLQRRLS